MSDVARDVPRPRRDAAVTRAQMAQVQARDQRIYDHMKDQPFRCEVCTGSHPLREHQECRNRGPG